MRSGLTNGILHQPLETLADGDSEKQVLTKCAMCACAAADLTQIIFSLQPCTHFAPHTQ